MGTAGEGREAIERWRGVIASSFARGRWSLGYGDLKGTHSVVLDHRRYHTPTSALLTLTPRPRAAQVH